MVGKNFFRITLVFSLSLVIVVLFACANEQKNDAPAEKETAAVSTEQMESAAWNKVCPVCGGDVSPQQTTVTFEGKVYGFGCAGCPEEFEEKPQDYVDNLSEDGATFIGG